MAFLSRTLTATEQKWAALEQWVALVSWALRKARRFTTTAPRCTVYLPTPEEVAVILDKSAHLRLRALAVDLTLYKVEWAAGRNVWTLGEDLVQLQETDVPLTTEKLVVPAMQHAPVQLKRPNARSLVSPSDVPVGRILV